MKQKRIKAIIKLMGLYILSAFITFIIEFNPTYLLENSLIHVVHIKGISCVRYNLIYCFAVSLVVCFILYCNTFSCKRNIPIKTFGAVFFSIVQTVAIDFYYFYSVIYVINCLDILFYNLLCIVSYGIVFYSIESVCFDLLDKLYLSNKVLRERTYFFEKHIGIFSIIVMLLCWLPWLIVFYPGSMWFDMCYQLEQYYFGNYNLHPVFATLCMGVCMDIGKHIFHSDNVGVFIYILLQSMICAYAFSKVIRLLKDLKVSIVLRYIILAYYSLLPIFGVYMQMGIKDVISCGLFILFTVQVVYLCTKIYHHESSMAFGEVVSLFGVSTLCSLYRKELVILCTITLIVLMIICLKERVMQLLKDVASIVVGMLIAYICFDAVVVQLFLNSTFDAGSTEAFSIPLQQVARFVYYEDDLVNEEEKDILNNCFNYGYDGIAGNYNPYLSDPIKYNASNMERFGDVWLSMFIKKPLIFIEATIANSFGYYSVIPQLPSTVNGAPTNGTPGSRFEFYINRDPDIENNMVMISYLPQFKQWRKRLSMCAYNLRDIPVINLIYSLGFYTWGAIILVLYILKERKKNGIKHLIVYVPFMLSVCVCIASPVNDCMRYFLPAIAELPIMVGWTVGAKFSVE